MFTQHLSADERGHCEARTAATTHKPIKESRNDKHFYENNKRPVLYGKHIAVWHICGINGGGV